MFVVSYKLRYLHKIYIHTLKLLSLLGQSIYVLPPDQAVVVFTGRQTWEIAIKSPH